jgi:hypothetical protein
MVCPVCVRPVGDAARFCPECGTRVSREAPPFVAGTLLSPVGRVARHRLTLGVLWCVEGGLLVLVAAPALVLLRMMGLQAGADWPRAVFPAVAIILGVLTALGLAAGYGVLARKRWGRSVAMVAGVVGLLHPPLGMALGAYTLWVLGPDTSREEWARTAEPEA